MTHVTTGFFAFFFFAFCNKLHFRYINLYLPYLEYYNTLKKNTLT